MNTSESTHFRTMKMEWLGSDRPYYIASGRTETDLSDGWHIEIGPADFEVCGAIDAHLTCMAREYHEHPHVGCVVRDYAWTEGNKVTAVSLRKKVKIPV